MPKRRDSKGRFLPDPATEDGRDRLPTPDSERYLRALEEWGAGEPMNSFCELIGISKSTVTSWRSQIMGFREQEQKIREEYISPKPPKLSDDHRIDIKKSNLTEFEKEWLVKYQKTRSRDHACRSLGCDWAMDVEPLLRDREKFRELYERIRQGIVVAIEDRLGLEGLAGNTSAGKAYLKAYMPERWGTKLDVSGTVRHDHHHRITREGSKQRRAWLEERKEKYLEAGDEDDVIEGEILEEATA